MSVESTTEFLTMFNLVEATDNPDDQRLLEYGFENNVLLDFLSKRQLSEFRDYSEEDDDDEIEIIVPEDEDKFKALVCFPASMGVAHITHVDASVAMGFSSIVYLGQSYIVAGTAEEVTDKINRVRNNNLIEDYKLKQQYGVTNE